MAKPIFHADYLARIPIEDWMNNGMRGSSPPSFEAVENAREAVSRRRVHGKTEE
jgi:hypothetical protein